MNLKQKILFGLALLIGWVIPGGGFWFIRRPLKALIVFCLISLLVVIGVLLADLRDVRFQDNPFYYLGRFGNGLIWLTCTYLMDYSPRGWVPLKYSEIGLLYICIAGALNLVILISFINSANKYFTAPVPLQDLPRQDGVLSPSTGLAPDVSPDSRGGSEVSSAMSPEIPEGT
jgi:hypothetical protein